MLNNIELCVFNDMIRKMCIGADVGGLQFLKTAVELRKEKS